MRGEEIRSAANYDGVRRIQSPAAIRSVAISGRPRERIAGPPAVADGPAVLSVARDYGFTQSTARIGVVQKTPPSVIVWFPPFSVARTSNS